MSETHNVNPADLPPEALITFDSFARLMPGVRRKTIEKAAIAGRFVPGIRMTERSPMVFRAGDVAAYLAERMAPLEASK